MSETEIILDHLRKAEDHIDTIQRRANTKRTFPKAWQILETIRGKINQAFIKFNEGDDCT